uniref:Integrase zinc-binding domain-containing protein n=1 Tax=Nicotiana tabacum TaxID=4097 RepID=A0A1S4BSM7_TOBAC|nr:PREDICTED: uncharacterized protein LOC107811458 [Nicotiana tabacum]
MASEVWTLFKDGASNIKRSGPGVVLITHSGETLRQAIKTVPLTNNENEYEALVAGLKLVRGLGSDDWRNEFIEYIRHGNLLEDPKASRSLRTKAARCCLVDGQLYTRSFQRPLALCLGASEADYMMREVHEGVCGNHLGTDSLVLKLVKVGYYWPHMEQDAKAFVQKCDKCQRHAQFVHHLAILLHLVVSPWPFMK